MTKLIDAELIIEELEKIIQLVKDADGVKVVPKTGDITAGEFVRTIKDICLEHETCDDCPFHSVTSGPCMFDKIKWTEVLSVATEYLKTERGADK